jgi:hypothetical protein
MFFGAIGMSISMAVLAGTISTGTPDPETGAPVLEDRFGITAVVMLFAFNSFFGIGWLGKFTVLSPLSLSYANIFAFRHDVATACRIDQPAYPYPRQCGIHHLQLAVKRMFANLRSTPHLTSAPTNILLVHHRHDHASSLHKPHLVSLE